MCNETGRIFVFYHTNCPNSANSIRFASRSPKSQLFSNEGIISQIINEEKPSVNAIYTVQAKKIILHVFWTEPTMSYESKVVYSKSENNGVYWDKPQRIASRDSASGWISVELAKNPMVTPAIVGLFNNLEHFGLSLFYSFDHGKTFDIIHNYIGWNYIGTGYLHNKAVCICGVKDMPKVYFMGIGVMLEHVDPFIIYSADILNSEKKIVNMKQLEESFIKIEGKNAILATCHTVGNKNLVNVILSGIDSKTKNSVTAISQYTGNIEF